LSTAVLPDLTATAEYPRSLLAVAVEACVTSPSEDGYGLVPAHAASLATVGVIETVKRVADSGRVFSSAHELASDGADLHTLVLTRFSPDRIPMNLWVIDGWSLLRERGAGTDLRGAPLMGAQLRGAWLKGADFTDADLRGADLEKADLTAVNLTGANLAGSILFSASLQGANLTEAELCRADLRHADLRECICDRVAFRGADLWGTYMWNVDISKAFTAGADFARSDYLNKKVATES